jgi:hypothetical protein
MERILCTKCGQAHEPIEGKPSRFCPFCGQPTEPAEPADAPLKFADEAPDIAITADLICPECHTGMEPGAVLCIHCGYNLKTRAKLKTEYKTTRREIDSITLSLPVRLVILINLLTIASFICVWLAATKSILLGGFLWLLACPLLVLGFGSRRLVVIQRDARGVPLLHVTRWIGFVPVGKQELDLRQFDAMTIHTRHGLCFESWMLSVALMLFCLLPGVMWMLYVAVQETYLLDVSKKGESVRIYDGTSDQKLRDLTDAIGAVVSLKIERK